MLSGPGCPVCVTPDGYIDAAIALGRERGALLASFGDMLRVPGKSSSLEKEKGTGLEVRVVYSPLDAVTLAAATPDREVVFLGVGFETTAPAIGGAIRTAAERGVRNFSVLSSVRTIPEAMGVLAADPEVRIEGFLCPAHVSVVIGTDAYRPVAQRYGIPCVVAGFEPLDILLGISMLLRQKKEGVARVENEYSRVATADREPEGAGSDPRRLRPVRHGVARDRRHPGVGPADRRPVRLLRRGEEVRRPRRLRAGRFRLPLRRRAQGEDPPGRLPPLREGVRAGGAVRSVHGQQRRELRGILQIRSLVDTRCTTRSFFPTARAASAPAT